MNTAPRIVDRLDHATDEQCALYGAVPSQWVYCCRCDQAISLEDLATSALYRPGRGLMHGVCPRPGTAPHVPTREAADRAARYAKAKARS